MKRLYVYVAKIPENLAVKSVYPKARTLEIEACGSLKVRREKYFVWKLLEHAICKSFDCDFEKLTFEKAPTGKWTCGEFYFSLTHSHGLAAVAVSKKAVGIDVELGDFETLFKVREKFLSPSEKVEFELLTSETEQLDFLGAKWTAKESEFKRFEKKVFSPSEIIASDDVKTIKLTYGGKPYYLSVASENIENICLHEFS